MIRHQIREEDRIVIIEAVGPLSEADSQSLTADVDRFLRQHGSLRGLPMHAKTLALAWLRGNAGRQPAG